MGAPLNHTQTGDSVGRHHDQMSEKALESNFAAEKSSATQEEYVASVKKQGFGSKVKRHCARFWWIHVIIFCVIFLIVSLLL